MRRPHRPYLSTAGRCRRRCDSCPRRLSSSSWSWWATAAATTVVTAVAPLSFSSFGCWILPGTTAWSLSCLSHHHDYYAHHHLHQHRHHHHQQQHRLHHHTSSTRNTWSSLSLSHKNKLRCSSSSSSTSTSSHERDIASSTSAMDAGNSPTRFATDYHAPVMWKECISALLPDNSSNNNNNNNDNGTSSSSQPQPTTRRIFVDGTLGGGGHTEALLQCLQPGDVVYGCDVDSQALEAATRRLQLYTTTTRTSDIDSSSSSSSTATTPLFVPVQCNFGRLHQHPLFQGDLLAGRVDGILLDLGVSSHQIDTVERGFTFTDPNGPLDMRMNNMNMNNSSNNNNANSFLSAADLCNELDAEELARILRQYGDEPRAKAKRIAQSIVERRPLQTTGDLQQAVAAVTPAFHKESRRKGLKATLARVFQALRIVVNQEDVMLEQALTVMAPTLLKKPGGRLVVLSYHSLEDRATKRVMRDGTLEDNSRHLNQKDMYGNDLVSKPFRPIGKALKASAEEVAVNPRARSAVLRVAEKL